MKIKVRKDAARIYARQYQEAYVPPNFREWMDKLRAIQGKTLEVETEYLFKDQYNTAPVPGVSERGLRLAEEYVEEVIDDVRPGKARCNWCGKTTEAKKPCRNCGKVEYLEEF